MMTDLSFINLQPLTLVSVHSLDLWNFACFYNILKSFLLNNFLHLNFFGDFYHNLLFIIRPHFVLVLTIFNWHELCQRNLMRQRIEMSTQMKIKQRSSELETKSSNYEFWFVKKITFMFIFVLKCLRKTLKMFTSIWIFAHYIISWIRYLRRTTISLDLR